ncbi:MAG: zf-HC2 domain-containing protein [Verrucomicrobiota bacterium]
MDAIEKWLRSLRRCLMPRCGEISRLSSRSLDGPLSFGERLSMRLHFATCLWCRRYHVQLRFLRRVFQQCVGSAKVQLSPKEKERMEQKIREKQNEKMGTG